MFWVINGLLAVCFFVGLGFFGSRALQRRQARRRRHEFERACQLFFRRREWIEARFLTMASNSGKPRGLEWANCDFENAVSFARDKNTGELCALVGVTISFEATIGGDMEDVEAVSNLRDATSVFRFEDDAWVTDGRAVFNLNPIETIRHFGHELELMV